MKASHWWFEKLLALIALISTVWLAIRLVNRFWIWLRGLGPDFVKKLIELARQFDLMFGWHKISSAYLGVLVLMGFRQRMYAKNTFDTTGAVSNPNWRSADGSSNDLKNPSMGKARTRLGRNVPPETTWPENDVDIVTPNPSVVSQKLLTRNEFISAPGLNVLSAAWIQFMIRDWVKHGKSPKAGARVFDATPEWDEAPELRAKLAAREAKKVKVDPDDWPAPVGRMKIPRLPTDPNSQAGVPPQFLNETTHWWDGSQLYGSSIEEQSLLRSHREGKLLLSDNDTFPPKSTQTLVEKEPGWWAGLALMFTIFAREHNQICDRLKARYPLWSDEEFFNHARLINTALIAKIHSLEWTAALLDHPITRLAVQVNWWGIGKKRFHGILRRISKVEEIRGIVGSPTSHHGVPYSMTEEFIGVYRMHPLIPDEFRVQEHASATSSTLNFKELTGSGAGEVIRDYSIENLLRTFGTSLAGQLVLHNYPLGLQEFERPDGIKMDLAAFDVMHTREAGVPRYNRFRELFGMRPMRSFEELTGDKVLAEELNSVYGNIDKVDLVVGLLAEKKPEGFAISDTAFRVFILMVSRRLKGDRFYTDDYRPEIYTQFGMDWIDDNDMTSVLVRNFPQLTADLVGVGNAFKPWNHG